MRNVQYSMRDSRCKEPLRKGEPRKKPSASLCPCRQAGLCFSVACISLLIVYCQLAYILSGTFMPNKLIDEAITLPVNFASFNLNCFFSSDSAFNTEHSV